MDDRKILNLPFLKPEKTHDNRLIISLSSFKELLLVLLPHTRSVRKVSDRIFLCEHLTDYNLARLHEPTLNLSAHA